MAGRLRSQKCNIDLTRPRYTHNAYLTHAHIHNVVATHEHVHNDVITNAHWLRIDALWRLHSASETVREGIWEMQIAS